MKHTLFTIIVILVILLIPKPVFADLYASPDTYVIIKCEVPGKIIEAGETAEFDLTVTNNGQEVNRKLWYESFETTKYDWTVKFLDDEDEINKISLPQDGSKDIKLSVETSSNTPVGEYSVRCHIGDGWYWAYITISKSHTGEKGTLELNVVDKEGEKIKGASVEILTNNGKTVSDKVMSAADGSVSTLTDAGTYILKVSKDGYKSFEKKDVKIKGGITTKSGTIMLEKALFAADLEVKSPMITTTVGKNPTYELTIRNIGKSEDTFRFTSHSVPEGWYVRFRESASSGSDISEIYLKSGDEKTLMIEAIPPYTAQVGDYNFSVNAESSQTEYSENLGVKIRGDYNLKVYADMYRYEVNKGDVLTIPLTIANDGNAGALTNIAIEVTAPEGWQAEIVPKKIPSLLSGEREKASIRVVPPANIVASEYKIGIKVKSDQMEKSDDFRVLMKEQSFVAILGLVTLGLICGSVYYMFRKYNRR
jgi:uncharacterized membrane protein